MSLTQTAPQPAAAGPKRLISVDALRGFDMFWIVGADTLVHALDSFSHSGLSRFAASQLTHKQWQGFAFYDLIFPLFVFIVGVSLVFSLSRIRSEQSPAQAAWRVIRRALLLYLVALFYSGGLDRGIDGIRWMGVLQRIALCYGVAGLLFLAFRPRALAAICAGLLLGYWAVMALTPIRDIQLTDPALRELAASRGVTNVHALFYSTTQRVTGVFAEGKNLANHIDFQYLPGRKWDKYWDPEGLLSNLPAVCTCLLGVFAGLLLRDPNRSGSTKVRILTGAGVAAVALGFLWGLQFPVVKKIWTSSYVLVAGGYSALLLALFYQVIEIWDRRQWAQPFIWIGMNSITIYLINNLIDFEKLALRIGGGEVRTGLNAVAPGLGELFLAIVALSFSLVIVWFLYRQKIFLRL